MLSWYHGLEEGDVEEWGGGYGLFEDCGLDCFVGYPAFVFGEAVDLHWYSLGAGLEVTYHYHEVFVDLRVFEYEFEQVHPIKFQVCDLVADSGVGHCWARDVGVTPRSLLP